MRPLDRRLGVASRRHRHLGGGRSGEEWNHCFARRNTAVDGHIPLSFFEESFVKRVTEAALAVAAMEPKAPITLADLEKWLRAAASLPPARKAAALLVADRFQSPLLLVSDERQAGDEVPADM
jgi:hypothetical protein